LKVVVFVFFHASSFEISFFHFHFRSIVEVEVDGEFFAIASIVRDVHEFATVDQIFA